MATKQPLNPTASGTRPAPSSDAPGTLPFGTKAATEDAKPEYDPSHFGIYEFEPGEREKLIHAKKPHIDPRLLQDTVPPNQRIVTKPDEVATTPRGGFAAPKLGQGPADPAADTLIAVPRPQTSLVPPAPSTASKAADSAVGRDAPTLPVVRLPKAARRTSGEAPSAPPVDTSRDQDTLLVPAKQRKRDRTRLVAAIVGGAFMLIGVAVARKCTDEPGSEATDKAAEQVPAEARIAQPQTVPTPATTPVIAVSEKSSAPGDPPPESSVKTAPIPKAAKPHGAVAAEPPSTAPPGSAVRAAASSSPSPPQRPRKRLFGTEPARPPTTPQ